MSWQNLLRLCLVVASSRPCPAAGPAAVGGADEEKEPQFLIGRSRVNAMDYQGAIEAFEQALETNPRSAAAHFELGMLYAEKDAAPARAIYHYELFLKLRPGAENAEIIRQHIYRLKQELAKGVLPIPPSTEIQRQLEQLAEENRQLRDQLDRMRAASSQSSPGNPTAVQPGAASANPVATKPTWFGQSRAPARLPGCNRRTARNRINADAPGAGRRNPDGHRASVQREARCLLVRIPASIRSE